MQLLPGAPTHTPGRGFPPPEVLRPECRRLPPAVRRSGGARSREGSTCGLLALGSAAQTRADRQPTHDGMGSAVQDHSLPASRGKGRPQPQRPHTLPLTAPRPRPDGREQQSGSGTRDYGRHRGSLGGETANEPRPLAPWRML